MNARSVFISGVRVDLNTEREILSETDRVIAENKKTVIAHVNAHAFNLASSIPWFKEFLRVAGFVVADGQGIRLACRMTKQQIPPHLPLTEWIWALLKSCEEKKYSVFLLGGQPEVVETASENLKMKYPGLTIAGFHHGYFQKKGEESDTIVRQINQASPDFLFVAFGMPLQEQWIMENLQALCVHAIVPMGGCIDELAGRRLPVPDNLRRLGFEWAWRLAQEPIRLSRRYITGNPLFMWRVVQESFNHRK